MKMFCIRAGTALIARFDATVAYLADALQALGDPDNEDERRLKACLIMANPTQAVELLHAYADHRAQKHGTHSGSGAGAGRGDDGDAGGGQDQPLPLHDDEPVGEGDVHPSQNDADDPDDPQSEPAPGRCPSCGGPGGLAGDPSAFLKPRPFRPGDIGPDSGTGRWSYDPTRLLPTITCYLHVSQDAIIRDRHGVARWEDEGPVTHQFVRENLAPYQRFIIKPVIDLAHQAPVDAYEIPDRHREAVRLLTPADSYPFSPTPTEPAPDRTSTQVDHTIAYLPQHQGGRPGQSRLGNYGPMSRFHHMIKTFGPLEVRQPFPGIYIWKNQYNQFFLVDHTGTRRITRAERRSRSSGHVGIQVHLDRDPIDYRYTHTA